MIILEFLIINYFCENYYNYLDRPQTFPSDFFFLLRTKAETYVILYFDKIYISILFINHVYMYV